MHTLRARRSPLLACRVGRLVASKGTTVPVFACDHPNMSCSRKPAYERVPRAGERCSFAEGPGHDDLDARDVCHRVTAGIRVWASPECVRRCARRLMSEISICAARDLQRTGYT
eukprot:6971387-Prymnesium_polylepis.1